MNSNQEIEVEVVEVGESRPIQRGPEPTPDAPQARSIPRVLPLRIPAYLWPLVIVLGLVLLALAVVIALVIAIPYLILRTIARLLRSLSN